MSTAVKVSVGSKTTGYDHHLVPGENLYTGEKSLTSKFGALDSLEVDLLNLASGIYATDLCIKRQERENYIRTIHLEIEVVNPFLLNSIKKELKYALNILSRDNWDIDFVSKHGTAVGNVQWQDSEGVVLLFSGGLDSMSGAVNFLEQKKAITLVSHTSQGNVVVNEHQTNVHGLLEKHYKQTIDHIQVKVYGRKKDPYEFPELDRRENSQRTRSFLFLALAVLVARRKSINRIVFMAENGQFAIHLPLNQSRIGPFSTHTADPKFMELATSIFGSILQNKKLVIENPFLYKTKAEVFAILPDKLRNAADLTASCWKISRTENNKHCGQCVPCISRRIAVEFNGIKFNEYVVDLFKQDIGSLPDDDTGKRNLIDYLEFISRFKTVTTANKSSIALEFPELYNDAIDMDKAIKMYTRVAKQSLNVFERYPNVKDIIG
jgi:7-cyano-7-deazaguanine synthase in queuosine biosynthesis